MSITNKLFGDWEKLNYPIKKWSKDIMVNKYIKDKWDNQYNISFIQNKWDNQYSISFIQNKYKDNSVVFPDINENAIIHSGIEFDFYKSKINDKHGRPFKHFGKPKKYPCIVCSLFKDGRSGPSYYHKINYKIKEKKCSCGKPIYEFEDEGNTVSIPHLCGNIYGVKNNSFNTENKKILPLPEVNGKEKKDKYPDMGQSKQDIDI
jgi:hypothetical protein